MAAFGFALVPFRLTADSLRFTLGCIWVLLGSTLDVDDLKGLLDLTTGRGVEYCKTNGHILARTPRIDSVNGLGTVFAQASFTPSAKTASDCRH